MPLFLLVFPCLDFLPCCLLARYCLPITASQVMRIGNACLVLRARHCLLGSAIPSTLPQQQGGAGVNCGVQKSDKIAAETRVLGIVARVML